MPNNQEKEPSDKQTAAEGFQIRPPAINLPKGGGAIKGIDEKFTVNPATGTGSLNVPIFTSPGRSNFQPQLSLSYNSGTGNGPFGMGWDLSVPSITRKTDKGIPRYWDQQDSDTFILSGTEDLVPVLEKKVGNWERKTDEDRVLDGKHYDILFFRPRIEGLFARIERWTNRNNKGDVFWRAITRDNIISIYGQSDTAKIADSTDASRIFKWLLDRTYDDKGNIISYEYKREDERRVVEDSETQHESWVHEKNRLANASYENQRYLKRVRYGNKTPYYVGSALPQNDDYLFEVVFDYGDHTYTEVEVDVDGEEVKRIQCSHTDNIDWPCRPDPFSSYRSGFEIRTYRLCRRVLMFHHFQELGNTPCLVRSTNFSYAENPVATKLIAATQTGYKRNADNAPYLFKSFPPIEFGYSEPRIDQQIREVPEESLENLPIGLDNNQYKWIDLDGEGISGILTGQGGGWFYKPNLGNGEFGPTRVVTSQPSLGNPAGANQQFLDLAGDGQLDLVILEDPITGFYERTDDFEWATFRPFQSKPNIKWQDPNLRFIDLNGDGHADILITEDDLFVWYPSLGEAGYGEANSVHKVLDEEKGPAVVFADASESIYLADMSGDGLTDIVRIRNGEVCYWPNLGYGRFGAKVTMASPPFFDSLDQFNPKRIRLGDIDGTGTNDIFYLGSHVIRIWYNRSGNSWSGPEHLTSIPHIDNLSSISVVDLLGHGTSCLVSSSPLPGDSSHPMKYIDLMGGQKPHLLVDIKNNLGAETKLTYAPSTKFYLEDKKAGKPWITRLSFPVHVVEKVETYDHISRNRFVTRYAYHHGYYDGIEREFRGFGRVDQWDTEQFTALSGSDAFPTAENVDFSSHVPPVLTKTWFHTGAFLAWAHVSDFFAGLLNEHDQDEYYREPAWRDDDVEAQKHLLDDTVLPPDLSIEEEREACRSLKGSMLRQEVYALDGTDQAEHPYTVTEQNFVVRCLQPIKNREHGVFFTHILEAINYHYERNHTDPRTSHTLTLEVDNYGNVLKSVSIGYGRRENIRIVEADGQVREITNPELNKLAQDDKEKQTQILVTYSENDVTNPIDLPLDDPLYDPDNYRTPLPCETRTYELTGYTPTGAAGRFQAGDFVKPDPNDPEALLLISEGEINYEDDPTNGKQRRLIENLRMLYRKDDLTDFLQLGKLEPLALPGESYKLAFTPGLLDQVYTRGGHKLLPPNPADVLEGSGADGGGYVDIDSDGQWWIHSGRIFLSPSTHDTPDQELAYARRHFFLPHRFRDPFHIDNTWNTETFVDYDTYNLLVIETRDPLDNCVTVGERKPNGEIDPTKLGNNYRVLQPWKVMDPNRNCSEVMYDALGMVVGTAVMGKPDDNPKQGDSLDSFEADLTQAQIDGFYDVEDPHVSALGLLNEATTRIIYALDRFHATQQMHPQDPTQWSPVYAATLARETHFHDAGGAQTKIQISFSYSDGFGREIQKKIQAEPGPVEGLGDNVNPRWVGSSWTLFNNKGKSVRQYEPFFSTLPNERHRFEFARTEGVSPILFYDPVGRAVATLHPNHTYEKVIFDAWKQETWDVNDTVALDPSIDVNVKGFFLDVQGNERIPNNLYSPTWYEERINGDKGPHEQAAAQKAAAHADTPTVVHFDSLGRTFITFSNTGNDTYKTRIDFDIEGNQRTIWDWVKLPNGDYIHRKVMLYDYDMLGTVIHQISMEAGARWVVNNLAGNPIRRWDSRQQNFRTLYDRLQRPTHQYLRQPNNAEKLVERLVYGEQHPEVSRNLRGQIYWHYEQAGLVTNEVFDFKGNLKAGSRILANDYKNIINWQPIEQDVVDENDLTAIHNLAAAQLNETFISHTSYDALNRPIQLVSPYNAQTKPNVIQYIYNEANLLERMDVWRQLAAVPNGLLDPATADYHVVTNINYNAKGQRELIRYGNGAETHYDYDRETFRLTNLYTRRGPAFTDDCGETPPRFAAPEEPPQGQPCGLQNLHYTYDPVGNITRIQDDAQQRIFFDNHPVDPHNEYIYDALYRLIEATGREYLGVNNDGSIKQPQQVNHRDAFRMGKPLPGDPKAVGSYKEEYQYDLAGNIESVHHVALTDTNGDWWRYYSYEEESIIEPNIKSNRLSATSRPGDLQNGPFTDTYAYTDANGLDVHGCITSIPHLALMQWDYRDQLHATSTQEVVNPECQRETTYYVYDAAGQRVRKVNECFAAEGQGPRRSYERIYLNGFEIYRKYNGNGQNITLQRDTLHVMDDKQRIAMVEMRTAGVDESPLFLIRYQLKNHLGSACLELDDQAVPISYEEYYPYGSTSYQAKNNQIRASAKRYRFLGKERDGESGLYYYGARYYAPWLARWTSTDPTGLVDGMNLYTYVRTNPIRLTDANGHYSWSEFGSDVLGGLKGAALGVIEPVLIVMDFGQMGAAMVAHAVSDDAPDVKWLSATGRRIEQGTPGWRAGLVVATAMPTGGGSVLADNVVTVFEKDMTPDEAQSFLVQGAVAQTAVTGLAMGLSKTTGSGWTGRGPAPDPATDQSLVNDLVQDRVIQQQRATSGVKGSKATKAAVRQVGKGTIAKGNPETPIMESQPGASGVHAEPQVLTEQPVFGPRTVVVDQIPCPGCTRTIQGKGMTGAVRVVVPVDPKNPSITPRGAVQRAAQAKGIAIPKEVMRVPFEPPIYPGVSEGFTRENEAVCEELTPAEIEAQQCLPEPERYIFPY